MPSALEMPPHIPTQWTAPNSPSMKADKIVILDSAIVESRNEIIQLCAILAIDYSTR